MDILAESREKITQGLAELKEQQEKLERALSDLNGSPPSTSPTRKPTRKQKSKRAPKGQRQQQFLDAVNKQPGITVAQAAKQLGVAPNQLYGIARKLHKEKAITKKGSGYLVKA